MSQKIVDKERVVGNRKGAVLVSVLLFLAIFAGGFVLLNVAAAFSPSLGSASSFAVLAGTAVTNVPTSVITGNVGLSPDAGSNYAGLTPAQVSGTIYAVDATGPAGVAGNNPILLTAAKGSLTQAYLDLGSQPCDTTYAGNKDLVGLSLAPGVYCADTFALSGTLTLTGSGVWIFKSAATLVTSGTANVLGGDPCNVWWYVPSSATLGTDTQLTGSILALTSITLDSRATLGGRALTQTAAVTLNANIITGLTCAVITTPLTSVITTPTTSMITSPTTIVTTIGTSIITSVVTTVITTVLTSGLTTVFTIVSPPPPPPPPHVNYAVGGEMLGVDRFTVLLPWVLLISGLAIIVLGTIAVKRSEPDST